jgi:hypothetical protein
MYQILNNKIKFKYSHIVLVLLPGSSYIDASKMYVIELLKRDSTLISKLSKKDSDVKDIYRIFRERLALYDRAAKMPLIEDDRKFLDYRRNEVCFELRIFKFIQEKKNLIETKAQIDKIGDRFVAQESPYQI